MDLEKELTCSICTELLFQPLTLLDCLHTFCGACLKEWFAFQASAAEKSPLPLPPAGTPLFTCPACRAAVRDTKHNATVATLLEMFTTAHPERDRKAAEKEELRGKYQPGEKVLPEVDLSSRSGQEQIDAEEDRRLMEQVRQMSLNEVGVAPSANPSGPTRPQYRRRRTDEGNPETEHRSRRRPVSHDGRQRARRDGSVSSSGTHSAGNYLQPGNSRSSGHGSDGGRRRRSIDQRLGENTGVSSDIAVGNGGEASAVSARQVEHQSSLRSLIGTTGMSEDDIAREVEELARQIQEEGLLDGLDLDNLDPSHHDELSQRIAQAYQRRQREKEREKERERERERDRQRTTETRRARTDDQSDTSRPPRSASAQRYRSRDHSRTRRSTTTTPLVQNEPRRNSEDRSRPPLAPSAGHHLEIESDYRRRRAASTGNSSTGVVRSATDTISRPPPAETHAVRSQTDLATRTTIASDNRAAKSQTDLVPQSVAVTSRDARSQTDLTLRTANQPIIGTQGITMSPRDHGEGARFNPTTQIGDTGLSFASRLPQVTVAPAPQISSPSTSSMGHRMVVETYIEGNGGERRVIVHDLVGGSMLKLEDHPGDRYLRWTTKENRKAVSRKVSRSVASDIPSSELEGAIFSVPRSRDLGMKATAGWSWFGQQEQAYDELYFPRGASLKEVELVGDSWYFGVFMDESGLFPAGYARVVSDA
ncbi:hypothetical protein BROUX41_003955 [Berkeleyomyces rouxiae]